MKVQLAIMATFESEFPLPTLYSDVRKLLDRVERMGCPVDDLPFTRIETSVDGRSGPTITLDRLPDDQAPTKSPFKAIYYGVRLLQAEQSCEYPGVWRMHLEYDGRVCSFDVHENKPDRQPSIREALHTASVNYDGRLRFLLGDDYSKFFPGPDKGGPQEQSEPDPERELKMPWLEKTGSHPVDNTVSWLARLTYGDRGDQFHFKRINDDSTPNLDEVLEQLKHGMGSLHNEHAFDIYLRLEKLLGADYNLYFPSDEGGAQEQDQPPLLLTNLIWASEDRIKDESAWYVDLTYGKKTARFYCRKGGTGQPDLPDVRQYLYHTMSDTTHPDSRENRRLLENLLGADYSRYFPSEEVTA